MFAASTFKSLWVGIRWSAWAFMGLQTRKDQTYAAYEN